MVGLGDKVKDPISGIEGIVMARTEWLYQCVRIIIQPLGADKDGQAKKYEHFDEEQLEVVEKAAYKSSIVHLKRERVEALPPTFGEGEIVEASEQVASASVGTGGDRDVRDPRYER